ncbi:MULTISPECIES: GNAT family N-acetyltransferase [unclassified Janthinobacterium]|uniref:GNAT family N-acetyltransferase n=1 Tax=unclassified Janthinobacterium TaxID=2610881 RepID=UPI00161F8D6E|nr:MULTISPECIES: GNAT family N-acetyltransferase [unclassified Janthinobacterium]MBB5368244.1 ribosomal protein S18 acetylase RimI-like enzyme [Janthinobacterium sp. K2C7]MBB5382219.1 ribosomal protein S18 acetylase RimI-like enzyme [Janthinobacterium sp. K2Li3]MBB5386626.1 ribosomal protein S18 acetylase RimI-like enzyme [Janthinobacterium sp. K2E3]
MALAASITVRATTPTDWRALKAIRLAALLDAPTAFGVSHASAAAQTDEEWHERASSSEQRAFFLAWDGQQAVGIAAQVVSSVGECQLIAMWVDPGYRGMDVAAQLVDAVKQRAVASGHRRLVLDVAPDNARAAAFYLKQGFVFLPEWEPLASHPHIQVQKMEWLATDRN